MRRGLRSEGRRLYGLVTEGRLFAFFGGKAAYIAFHHAYLRRWGRAFWAFEEDDLFANASPRRYVECNRSWEIGEWCPRI